MISNEITDAVKRLTRGCYILNPNLQIEGILLTMVDSRTNYARDIVRQVHEASQSGTSWQNY